MHYSILIYASEGLFERLPAETQDAVLQAHRDLQEKLSARGGFASGKLMPVSSAVTIKSSDELGTRGLVVDGPFAETKERFMGFYVYEADTLEDAMSLAETISSPYVTLEVRPVSWSGGVLADL